jgi:type I restriction enzyme, S subunit
MEENQVHIPDRWVEIIQLGNLSKVFNGLSGKKKDDFGEGEPYIPYVNVFKNSRIDPSELDYVKVKIGERQNAVEYGDIIFTTSSETIEEVGMTSVFLESSGKYYLNSFCFILRLNNKNWLNPEFAQYLFRSEKVRYSISLLGQGSTRYNLSKTRLLKELKLIIPSDPTEQTTIARILSKVDEAIAQTEQLIAKYTRIKTGLMQDLLTKGIDEHGNIRSEQTHDFKDSPLGRIPKEWECELLGENNIELHNNKRKPISSKERAKMIGDYPYYGATGIIDMLNVYKVDGEFVLFGEDGDHFLKWVYQEQTILTNGKFNVSNHAHIVKGTSKCSTKWIHYFFCHRDITYYLTRQGAGRFKLNKASLLSLPILIPKSKNEQESIIQRIEKLNENSDELINKLSKLQSLKTGLMQDLLSGKVRVKV